MYTGASDTVDSFPHVRVSGSAFERGVSYSMQARERVERSIEGYARVFSVEAGLEWPAVRELAKRFEEPIGKFGSGYLEELRGIANGAGVDLLDVLALNVRTEIMFSAKARGAAAAVRRGECTSYALVPAPGGTSPTIIGQNWDWLVHCFETLVVLESERQDGPNFVTVVEAGLLAKMGMNAAGLGLVTNALVTDADKGEPGIPYHVLLRAILDCERVVEAFETLQRAHRSSSANYLVAHEDGSALDVEAAPGDFSRLFLVDPSGPYLHTNHFLSARFDGRDVSLWAMPDSPVRLGRVRAACVEEGVLDAQRMMALMVDHAGFPDSVCCHPDSHLPLTEQFATIASVVMEPTTRTMWLADGQPCQRSFRRLDYAEFLKGPSSEAPMERP